jgi:hypothetical protein
MKAALKKLLDEFYGNEIPGYILDAGKTFLKIKTDEVVAILQEAEITIQDVVIYYARDAKDIYSGCRTLARITGDQSTNWHRNAWNGSNSLIRMG